MNSVSTTTSALASQGSVITADVPILREASGVPALMALYLLIQARLVKVSELIYCIYVYSAKYVKWDVISY